MADSAGPGTFARMGRSGGSTADVASRGGLGGVRTGGTGGHCAGYRASEELRQPTFGDVWTGPTRPGCTKIL